MKHLLLMEKSIRETISKTFCKYSPMFVYFDKTLFWTFRLLDFVLWTARGGAYIALFAIVIGATVGVTSASLLL